MDGRKSRQAYVEVANGRFHYLAWDAGSETENSALILLHGFNQTAHSWTEVGPQLAHNRSVIAITQRGHGTSYRATDQDYSRASMAEDVVQIADAMGLDRFTLGGMSMGGGNAIYLATEYADRVIKLITVDYAPDMNARGIDKIRAMLRRHWPSFDAAVREVMAFNPARSEANIRDRLQSTLAEQDDGGWTWAVDPAFWSDRALVEEHDAMWQRIARVECPVLLVRGERSDVLDADTAVQARDCFPRGRAVTVADAGHSVAGDNPAGFVEAVLPFLD